MARIGDIRMHLGDNPDDNETWSFRWTELSESDQKLAGQAHLQRTRAKDISA